MGALRGKWLIYGPGGWGICGGYNLQVGYIGANGSCICSSGDCMGADVG